MLTTGNSPAAAHLLDVTRTVRRFGQRPTGIDRIERAYLAELLTFETALFGLVRTRLGYLLLDKAGCAALLKQCDRPTWDKIDLVSRLTRRVDIARATAETALRKLALDRATPARLTQLLHRNLPSGAVYFNIGQTNLNDRLIHALRSSADIRICIYLHDTIPLDFPETQTPTSRLKFKRMLDHVDRHADLVLCNSSATKESLRKHTRLLDPDKIHVLRPGLHDMTIGAAPQGPWTGAPYFMAIGTIEPRKNIGFLLDLWEDMATRNAPHLVLCGKRGWLNEPTFRRLDQNLPHVHEVPNLPDDQLWALLNRSAGLLFPSRAEGFGFPAIEAAHLNVPLICNPLPVFREVLGDYPIYADESDRYAWRHNIEQLAQRRRDQSGEQYKPGAYDAPSWRAHFNQLFTLL